MSTPPSASLSSASAPSLSYEQQAAISKATRRVILVAALALLALVSFVFLSSQVVLPLFLAVAIILTSLSHTNTGTHLFYRIHCIFFPPPPVRSLSLSPSAVFPEVVPSRGSDLDPRARPEGSGTPIFSEGGGT